VSDTGATSAEAAAPGAALPRHRRIDWAPLLLVPVLAMAALPLVGALPAWATLTAAGLAMGMMIFIMASGLTLVFGLMDVLNFGHGGFISVGAFVGTSVLLPLAGASSGSVAGDLVVMVLALLAAAVAVGAFGYAFERVIIRPVYGDHLKQILITTGGLIVAQQLIPVIWGPEQVPLPRPASFRGSFLLGEIAIERYRLVAVAVGLLIFLGLSLVLRFTRVGLLIRAGVENREMVEALGYRIRRLFIAVFVAGAALAGIGGVMWALYTETVTAGMGMQVMVLVFIVVIIGGMGSLGGCCIAALLVGLTTNYLGFLTPTLGLVSDIGLMVLILLWRPEGLFPMARR
jgi:branched-chain amino acid transport system permease protein